MKVCRIEGCKGKVRAHGLCNKHDLRAKRNGSPYVVKRVNSYDGQKCQVASCTKLAFAKFLCKLHYERQAAGLPQDGVTREVQICSRPDCLNIVKCVGLCSSHYNQSKYYQYRAQDPWRYRAYSHERRKLVQQATPWNITVESVVQRMQAQGSKCWMCGKPASTIDHVKPLSKGGLHILANMRPACLSCNSRKRNRWFGTKRLDELVKT